MITEHDLQEAIAECEGIKNPSANTCIKLAAFYTILNHLNGNEDIPNKMPMYSYSSTNDDIHYSDSEFSQLVRSKGIHKVYPILDDLMDALQVINPKLYKSAIRKIENL